MTGEEAEINKILLPFTGKKAGNGMHIPSTFIANGRTGFWTSSVGVFAPAQLLKTVDSVADPRNPK